MKSEEQIRKKIKKLLKLDEGVHTDEVELFYQGQIDILRWVLEDSTSEVKKP